MALSKEFKAAVLGATLVAGGIAMTGCTPPPPPPHNEYNITMKCIGHAAERFENVSLFEGATLYHVRRYDVVDGNRLKLSFEKNFRKFGCTMEREAAAPAPVVQPTSAPAPK